MAGYLRKYISINIEYETYLNTLLESLRSQLHRDVCNSKFFKTQMFNLLFCTVLFTLHCFTFIIDDLSFENVRTFDTLKCLSGGYLFVAIAYVVVGNLYLSLRSITGITWCTNFSIVPHCLSTIPLCSWYLDAAVLNFILCSLHQFLNMKYV